MNDDGLDYFALRHRFDALASILWFGLDGRNGERLRELLHDAVAAELRGHALIAHLYLAEVNRRLLRLELLLGAILPLRPLRPRLPLFGPQPIAYEEKPDQPFMMRSLIRFGGVIQSPHRFIMAGVEETRFFSLCWLCGERMDLTAEDTRRFCGEVCEIAFRRAHGDPEDLTGP